MLEISHLRYDVTAEDGNDLGILRDVSLAVGDGKLVVITAHCRLHPLERHRYHQPLRHRPGKSRSQLRLSTAAPL